MCEAPEVEYFERLVLLNGILMQDAKRDDDEFLPQTFQAIGRAIGTTPDGARKVVGRALDAFRRAGGTLEGLELLRDLLRVARTER